MPRFDPTKTNQRLRPSQGLAHSTALDDGRATRWAVRAIAAFTIAQVAFLLVGCDWELIADEAEYWAWSRQLDWSYYAKGPLIAALIRLGTTTFGDLSLALTGTLMPAVRLPAVILGGLTGWGVFRLAQLASGSTRAGLIAVLLMPAVPLFRVGGLLMTIDTPLLCCWTWAAVWSYRAILGGRAREWLFAGVLGAMGVLAKYTMLAFPASIGMYLLLAPSHRKHLLRPGFWAMSGLCMLGMVPIVAWNAGHGWVGAAQMADRVGLTSFSRSTWAAITTLLGFLGAEVAVWGVAWWAIGLLALRWSIARVVRGEPPVIRAYGKSTLILHNKPDRGGLLYLLCLWAPIWLACVAVCFLGENEANWGAPGYIGLLVLIGRWLDRGLLRDSLLRPANRWGVAIVVTWAVGMVAMTAIQHTEWFYPILARWTPAPTESWPAPMSRLDPTNRMRGHRGLVPEVERVLSEMRAAGEDPFLVAPTPYLASELTFYMKDHPEVHALSFSWTPEKPVNQHDLWHPNPRFDPDAFRGRPAIIVEDAHMHPSYAESLVRHRWFARSEPSKRILVREAGVIVAAWDVSIDRDYRGRPDRLPRPGEFP
jgi:hypothetical protein